MQNVYVWLATIAAIIAIFLRFYRKYKDHEDRLNSIDLTVWIPLTYENSWLFYVRVYNGPVNTEILRFEIDVGNELKRFQTKPKLKRIRVSSLRNSEYVQPNLKLTPYEIKSNIQLTIGKRTPDFERALIELVKKKKFNFLIYLSRSKKPYKLKGTQADIRTF